MFNFDRNPANEIFIKMVSSINFVIAETITSDSFCSISSLLEHIGFNTNDLRTYDISITVHKTAKGKILRTISDSHINIYQGFIECGICNCKKKCFRQCENVNKLCFECFKDHNKEYINTCPYCRYSLLDHSRYRTVLR